MSVFFRAIPLVMGGAVCLAYGLYVDSGGADANHYVASHVVIALTAICYALFTTAATIIRQLIDRYATAWRIVLPLSGYLVAFATVGWGISILCEGGAARFVVTGHVIIGIGLVATCVSSVATASTAFVLIPRNAARRPEDPPPESAYSEAMGLGVTAIPVVCALTGFGLAGSLLAREGTPHRVAGLVVLGLSAIAASLIALVASIARQVRNTFGEVERYRWSGLVIAMGTMCIGLGAYFLIGTNLSYRITPGYVLIGLGLVCFSILSKALLLALVWRQSFPLANRIPILPVGTALACLFLAAFLFEAAVDDPQFFVPARVLVGLGAVCFTLFSIVSILEAGTSG